MNKHIAIIIVHLLTTVPILLGIFVVLGSVGACEVDSISISQMLFQSAVGAALVAIGSYFSSKLS